MNKTRTRKENEVCLGVVLTIVFVDTLPAFLLSITRSCINSHIVEWTFASHGRVGFDYTVLNVFFMTINIIPCHIKIFIRAVITLRMAITDQGRMNTLARLVTQEI